MAIKARKPVLAVLAIGVRLWAEQIPSAPTVYDAATTSLRAADAAHAMVLLMDFLRTHPNDFRALNLLGIALTQQGGAVQANDSFRRAIAIRPDFYPAVKNLAVNEYADGHFDEAGRLFQSVLKFAPTDGVANAYLGELAYRKSDFRTATRFYTEVHGNLLEQPSILIHAADAALRVDEYKYAQEMLGLLPLTDGHLQFQAGMLLGRAGLFGAAANHFQSARAFYLDHQIADYDYLLMLTRAGQLTEAIQTGKQLISSGAPLLPETYSVLAETLLKAGEITDAWDVLRAAIKADANREQTYIELGSIAQDYQGYDLALEVLNVGLDRLPGSSALRVHRGMIYVLKGQMTEAKADFTAAHDLNKTATSPILALSVCLIDEGQYDRAAELLRASIGRGPGESAEWYFLGKARARSGASADTESRDVEQAFANAVRLDSKFVSAHVELGKILLNRGEAARAISELETALGLDPGNRTAMTQLVRAYRGRGNEQAAEAMAKQLAHAVAAGRNEEVHMALKRIVRLDGAQGGQLVE